MAGQTLKKFPNDGAPNYKKRNFAHFIKTKQAS